MKMELAVDMPNLAQQFNSPKRQNDDSSCHESISCQLVFNPNETIDITQLDFEDEETWLYDCPYKSNTDLHKWLYQSNKSPDHLSINESYLTQDDLKSEFQKNIDTRTFTRPKKRFTRPSIEKYNEELYGNSVCTNLSKSSPPKRLNDSGIFSNGASQDGDITPTKPLHFDLTQPTNSFYFENILANASSIDSFQNMSPPSLVNSMCSSTFANLMENSFIKNDPVLREIRDTDYTDSILQQESEPLFQSFTESCSSLNSDVPENFLKKVSFNESFKKSFTKSTEGCDKSGDGTVYLDATFRKNDSAENSQELQDAKGDATVIENLNGTYQRTPKLQNTFRVADVSNGKIKLNTTFQKRQSKNLDKTSPELVLNSTITVAAPKCEVTDEFNSKSQKTNTMIIEDTKTPETGKRLLNRRECPSLDLNRLSFCAEDKNEQLNVTFVGDRNTNDIKRNSLSGSTDSTENLDYMSISSSSSKNSSKILSMEGINAIVEEQERSLQVMSTPKPDGQLKKLWENNFISPIDISGRNSDPDLSSNQHAQLKVISPNAIRKQKSLGHINSKEVHPKSINTVVGASKLQTIAGNIRGSYPNLKTTETNVHGLQSNLLRPSIPKTAKTNLSSMRHTLKGSYTSLKPISANLPVAPPLNSTITRPKSHNVTQVVEGQTRVAQVPPILREAPLKVENAQFVKPQQLPRTSGLPRPVSAATGIPRPVSRIPGPRNVRSVAKPAGSQGRQTSYGYN